MAAAAEAGRGTTSMPGLSVMTEGDLPRQALAAFQVKLVASEGPEGPSAIQRRSEFLSSPLALAEGRSTRLELFYGHEI